MVCWRFRRRFFFNDSHARGGNDRFYGVDDGYNYFAGDEEFLNGHVRGGNDDFFGGENAINNFIGDGYIVADGAEGGNDEFFGGDAVDGLAINVATGDAGYVESDPEWVLGDGYYLSLFGLTIGAGGLYDGAIGGNDELYGGHASDGGAVFNFLVGDGYEMGEEPVVEPDEAPTGFPEVDGAYGGHDYIVGGNAADGYAFNALVGDAELMYESIGGNDEIVGGNADGTDGYSFVWNTALGDGYAMYESTGGNDEITGGSGTNGGLVFNVLVGDGYYLSESTGGDDVITGGEGDALNILIGDGYYGGGGEADTFGGNDTLMAGDTGAFMVGDFFDTGVVAEGDVYGGNDTLVSGFGNDEMWGDAFDGDPIIGGADTFVFMRVDVDPDEIETEWVGNGMDRVGDFEVEQDKIDLSTYGIDFATLQGLMSDDGSDTTIDLGSLVDTGDAEIVLVDVLESELTEDNFIFS